MLTKQAPVPSLEWSPTPPVSTGRYQWRQREGARVYAVQVSSSMSIRDEFCFGWRCWELTDFTEMETGGEWRYLEPLPVAQLNPHQVAALMDSPSRWREGMPVEEGRYLHREDEGKPPVLILLREGVSLTSGKSELFVQSYGHSTLHELKTACRYGLWARVPDNISW